MDSTRKQHVAYGLWGVRYQVKDVQRSVAFYTETLGFSLDQQNLPAFGQVSIGHLKLILSGPGASGSRPMSDGRQQEPGGWNRVVLEVKDLPTHITELKNQGVRFRNEMEAGPGGRQVQIEDPDGNPIELFESALKIQVSPQGDVMGIDDMSDEEVLAIANPIMDNLMDASTVIDHERHVRDFTERLKSIVTPEYLRKVCQEYQTREGFFERREPVAVFKRPGAAAIVWRQWFSKVHGQYVAEMLLVERDGKYLVDHAMVF